MRSSIILASLLATLAFATPVDKRYLTTKVEVYTVWTTVTKGAEPTYQGRHRSSRSRRSSASQKSTQAASSSVAAVPSSVAPSPSQAPAPSSEPAPVPSSEPAPAPSSEAVPDPVSSKEPAAPPPESSAAAPPPTPTPSPDPAPVFSDIGSYAQKVLDQHNIHRVNHTNTGALTWSDQLAATALKIAKSCNYAHDTQTDKAQYGNGQGYGQNIGAGAPADAVPAMITNGMYNDEAPAYEGLYGQDNPSMSNFHAWGHFSQIVWRNTKQVGCATYQCTQLANTGSGVRPFFTVCNYFPPGNYGGQYTNVGTRLGKPTVSI